jgi:sugar O-acyltransferase (sialic acid O-acetyltransferase NeuD family)
MTKIVIWGAGGQAIVLEELLLSTQIKIKAFFENDVSINSPIEKVPIYYGETGFNQWLSTIRKRSEYYFLVAIGGNKGYARYKIGEILKESGLQPYTAVHRTAFVATNAIIGEGSQILAHSSVCARVKTGKYCIINTAASVDHECLLGNNVHIGPGAKLAGCVQVGNNVFIGTNATILPRISIGENSVVGAGAVVIKNISADSVVVGNPARVI